MRQNWLEWAILAVSGVALAGVIVFLTVDGISDAGAPPRPVVTLDADGAYQTDHGWLVPATVGNAGDTAAVELVIEAEAEVMGATESAEVTVDFLPAGTDVEVTFGFSDRPDGVIGVRIIGFRLP